MKQQFKVGDTVRLKKNLKVGKMYDFIEMRESMKFDGSNEIRKLTYNNSVLLKDNPFYYPFCMLIKVKTPTV